MTRTSALVSLAQVMGLEPAHAIALPTVIEVSASKVGMSQPALIAEALRNEPLRAYLAQICATVIDDKLAA